jgi:hypothetical protein
MDHQNRRLRTRDTPLSAVEDLDSDSGLLDRRFVHEEEREPLLFLRDEEDREEAEQRDVRSLPWHRRPSVRTATLTSIAHCSRFTGS